MTDAEVVAGWWYFPALWAILVVGLVASFYFLVTWRPETWWRPRLRELDAGGWVTALFLLYLMATVQLLAGREPPIRASAVAGLILGVAIDALLVVRALHWRAMRRAFRNGHTPGRRSTDVVVDVRDGE